MPLTPQHLAAALRNTLERGPSPEAHWTLAMWEAQQDQPDGGRGLARLLWQNYAYAIGQLAQLSEYDRHTMANAVVRYFQTYRAAEDLTASRLLAEWQIAIDRRAQQCAVKD
jgi:hypothetical protein